MSADLDSPPPPVPNGRTPLQPHTSNGILGWLRVSARGQPGDRRSRLLRFGAPAVASLVLGTVGFHALAFPARLTWLQSFYHAVKLFAVDLGPTGGGSKPNIGPNLAIWIAFVLAVSVVLRAVFALVREGLRRWALLHKLSGHVIVCGAGVHGARLADVLTGQPGQLRTVREEQRDAQRRTPERPDETPIADVVVIDRDPSAPGLQTSSGSHRWQLIGDAILEETLLNAGVSRASWVVAITGDDYVNSQIVSAVHRLAEKGLIRDNLHVPVQIEDPSLARFLEGETPAAQRTESKRAEGEEAPTGGPASAASPSSSPPQPRPVVSPFSANAIAAEALLRKALPALGTESSESLGADSSQSTGTRDASIDDHLILGGDHPLLDAIVLAAIRRLRVRFLRRLESGRAAEGVPDVLRISIYGSGAAVRTERLRGAWMPLEFDAGVRFECKEPDPAAKTAIATEKWLHDRRSATHAIVACVEELDGIMLTLGISRALGDGVPMTRVTTQPESQLDAHIEDRTRRSHELATTNVEGIAELAGDRRALFRLWAGQRLIDALSVQSPELAGRDRLSDLAQLGLRSDPTWRPRASELAIAQSLLAPVRVSALVDAGLAIDLASHSNLLAAADKLPEDEAFNRFYVWCEYARHLPAARGLDVIDPDADVARRLAVILDGHLGDQPRDAPRPAVLGHARRVAIVAGGANSFSAENIESLRRLLSLALEGYEGAILSGGTSVGLPGVVRDVARRNRFRAVGYVPAGESSSYPVVRPTLGDSGFTVREPLAMWTDILAAGIAVDDVRVLVCPGGEITYEEILLARALGARIAWLDPADETAVPLDEVLPFGDDRVLEIPTDAMTIRAFLRWSTLSGELHELLGDGGEIDGDEVQERIARFLHSEYEKKHGSGRKALDDPALSRWERLLPALQNSNRAQADDIPNKLAAVGKRLARTGERLRLSPEEIELLAEIEHGRWNIERLSAGWRFGARDVVREISPHLRPWDDLEDDVKEYDREAVRNIEPALQLVEWGVEDLGDLPASAARQSLGKHA